MEDPRMEGYALGKIIHAGPRTVLYLATRKSDGGTVIVKTLPVEHHPADAERIRNEFAIGSKLGVPGVMQPLELRSLQGRPALVLEYFDGGPLQDEAARPMETGRFLDAACRIAVILAGIHGKKILHKDIKPDN